MNAAETAREILARGVDRDTAIARIVSLSGFGGRSSGDIMAISPLGNVGSLLFGSLSGELERHAQELRVSGAGGLIVEVHLGDQEAIRSGLACGGVARVALVGGDDTMQRALREIASRNVVAVATGISGSEALLLAYRVLGLDPVFSTTTEISPDLSAEINAEFDTLLGRRRNDSYEVVLSNQEQVVHVELYSPPSRCLILGYSALATAIGAQFEMIGVAATIVETLEDARGIVADFSSNDALILLSHDHEIGVPLIRTLIGIPGIYLGALGSRHTQEARRQILSGFGYNEGEIDRIYGPVGLDIGSRSVSETALAIAAEFVAHRSGRNARSLRESSGAING